MLMGANQLGQMWEISERLFLDLRCVTRQTGQAAPMCEIDDLSHSQEAQWKERDTPLISHCEHNKEFRIMKNAGAVFQVCPSSSDGPICHEASTFLRRKLILPSHVFLSLPLPNKFLQVTHSEREYCESTKLLLLIWKRGKRKWECMCLCGLLYHLPKSLPALPRLAMTDPQAGPMDKDVLP